MKLTSDFPSTRHCWISLLILFTLLLFWSCFQILWVFCGQTGRRHDIVSVERFTWQIVKLQHKADLCTLKRYITIDLLTKNNWGFSFLSLCVLQNTVFLHWTEVLALGSMLDAKQQQSCDTAQHSFTFQFHLWQTTDGISKPAFKISIPMIYMKSDHLLLMLSSHFQQLLRQNKSMLLAKCDIAFIVQLVQVFGVVLNDTCYHDNHRFNLGWKS